MQRAVPSAVTLPEPCPSGRRRQARRPLLAVAGLATAAALATAGFARAAGTSTPEHTAAQRALAGEYAAALAALRAPAADERKPATQARALAWQARIQVDRGDFAAAEATLARAAPRAEGSGDAEARARVHFARGLLFERRQTAGLGGDARFAQAGREYAAALALADAHALPWRALARFRVGVVAERTGDSTKADRLYAQVLAEARRLGDLEAQAYAELHRANLAWDAGPKGRVQAGLERARRAASRARLAFVDAAARLHLAHLTGPEAGARSALEVAEALRPRLQGLPGQLDGAYVSALETAAELTLERDPAGARVLNERALAQAERSGLVAMATRLRKALSPR